MSAALTSRRSTSDFASNRLQAARAVAISKVAPYFGTALSSMVMHPVTGLGTVATDTRWRFYYDPEVVCQWSLGTCVSAWLHELMHNLHRHGNRFEAMAEPADRHVLFNCAADALINEDLREMAELVSDPAVMQMDENWVYLTDLRVAASRAMMTEAVYRLLVEQDRDLGDLGSRFTPNCEPDGQESDTVGARGATSLGSEGRQHSKPSVPSEESRGPRPSLGHDCGSAAGSARRDRWWELPVDDGADGSVDPARGELIRYDSARQIDTAVRQRGEVPAGLLRWAESTLQPAVDWRTQLRSVVTSSCAAVAGRRNYTYSMPSRRQAPPGVIMPRLVAPAPPGGVIVIDTSASMSSEDLAQGVAEVAGVLKQVSRGRSRLSVITCDQAASAAAVVRRATDVQLVGGGGTDMSIGIAAAAALRPRADFIVTFTDGYTPWPATAPEANRTARYIAVLCGGDKDGVPDWMRKIVIAGADSEALGVGARTYQTH